MSVSFCPSATQGPAEQNLSSRIVEIGAMGGGNTSVDMIRNAFDGLKEGFASIVQKQNEPTPRFAASDRNPRREAVGAPAAADGFEEHGCRSKEQTCSTCNDRRHSTCGPRHPTRGCCRRYGGQEDLHQRRHHLQS